MKNKLIVYIGSIIMLVSCQKESGKIPVKPSAEPFFIYWAINMPHYPYQGNPEWLEHYENLESSRKEYAAFISTMDKLIGNVLDHLDLDSTESKNLRKEHPEVVSELVTLHQDWLKTVLNSHQN